MDLVFEAHYPHPIERVWRALTTPEELAQWLMRNDFVPEVGRSCVFRFCPNEGGKESLVYVTVEALDPPRMMRWRWRNQEEENATTVTFELSTTETGTLLQLRHSGDAPPELVDRLRRGWPTKLADLEGWIGS